MELNYSPLKHVVIFFVLIQLIVTTTKSQVVDLCDTRINDVDFTTERIRILAKVDSFYMIDRVRVRDTSISDSAQDIIRQQYYNKESAIQLLANEKINARKALIESQNLVYNNLRLFYLAGENYSLTNYLIGHLDVPKSFRDTLINDPNIVAFIKARLGDEKSENIVIEHFNKIVADTANFEYVFMKKAAEKLLYINSKQSINAYFNALEQPYIFVNKVYYEGTNWIFKDSYASMLLDIFHKTYRCKEEYKDNRKNYQSSEEYYRVIEALIKKDFGITIKITAPFFDNEFM